MSGTVFQNCYCSGPWQRKSGDVIDLEQFERDCQRDIPLLTAMQLRLLDYRQRQLRMQAPLAPNINNKGTAFGGSIASICLFGGWAVATLAFTDDGVANTEIVVHRNEMTFEQPAHGLLEVLAVLDDGDYERCLRRFENGDTRRLRLGIEVELHHDKVRCASMRGEYVAWLK